MTDTELFKEVVELRYVGAGDDELGNGTFYLIFEWSGAMNRALENLQNIGLSKELSFDVTLLENKLEAIFLLRDRLSGIEYATSSVRCTESDISDFRTEDAFGKDSFAFGMIKVVPADMDAITVKDGTAYRKSSLGSFS